MIKNIQIKIILIFFVLGVVIISGLGFFFINMLEQVNPQVSGQIIRDTEELSQIVMTQISQTKILILVAILVFCFITLLVGIFVAKVVVSPISRLVKNAERLAAGENVDVKIMPKKNRKSNSEVDELVDAFGIMTDGLKENLNEVNSQKRQVETILLHMTDGIISFDKEGKVTYINPAAKRLLNIEEGQNTFETIFDKLEVDINREKIIYLENWTSSEQRVTIEDKVVNLLFAPYKDENDIASGVVVVIQDITEHVKLDNMRKEFVADVSHELKTPITSIMGYADTLLEEEYDKETQDKFLNVIASEARRMARLVTDLLTLSRYDNNKVKKEETEFDLGELVKKCQEKLAIEVEKKKQHVECFVTANVPPIHADKYGIERVVLNILSNSIKYTPEEGNIKIYVGFVYNDAYIKVIDSGIGIPQQDLSRIFERFYRVDKARTREMGGTGLGLSIAKEILDQNHGSIDIKSEVGKGTEVVIRLPAKKNVVA